MTSRVFCGCGGQYQIYDRDRRRAWEQTLSAAALCGQRHSPRSRLDPVSLNIAKYWAEPTGPGAADGSNNYTQSTKTEEDYLVNFASRSQFQRAVAGCFCAWIHALVGGAQERCLQQYFDGYCSESNRPRARAGRGLHDQPDDYLTSGIGLPTKTFQSSGRAGDSICRGSGFHPLCLD